MMRICMVVYSLEEFGGLEEIATTLAIGLQEQGHDISVLSTAWAFPDNQYLCRFRDSGVQLIQLPKWLSLPASDWLTKDKIIAICLWFLTPAVYLLSFGLLLFRRRSWKHSRISAHGWVRGQLSYIIRPDRRKPLIRLLLNWWRFRWKPDLIHIHGYTNNLLFVIDWAEKKKLPIVYVENQTPDAQFDWWQDFQCSINKATIVVAPSERSAQALHELCGVVKPIEVFQPNVEDPMVSGWRRVNKLRQDNKPLHVTTVARLWVTKGLNYLLEAIVMVRSSHPGTIFRVYGDGSLRQELIDRAEQLGLDGQSIFVGSFTTREELFEIMKQTDIFVMSSILEGQPLAIVEAMSFGCPIVTTAVGGIPELIEDGITGFLCKPRDSACLAQKISTLIEDFDLRRRLGQAARQAYEQGPYQPASVTKHFISIYKQTLREEYGV